MEFERRRLKISPTESILRRDIQQLEVLIAGLSGILTHMQQRLQERPEDVSLRLRYEGQKIRRQMAQREHTEMTKLLQESVDKHDE